MNPHHLELIPDQRPTCAVHGMPHPRAICSQIITGMKFCGHDGECQHKRQPADTGAALAAVNAAHAAGTIDMSEETSMTPNHINGIRIFEMNDCDWVAARSKEDAIQFYGEIAMPEDFENVQELSAQQLDSLQFHVDDNHNGPTITFRQRLQQLVDADETLPQLFASTEF
ncbi:hypothetical protein [Chromobacterium phragmitis]|uniref:hypothetical protein n=1 Tax=Chromobacterium phragmitis TaxID=2202141 RepID=UPI0011AE2A16|nr:hypothetical protein [Chromobacterium phragmitis]